MLPRLPDQLRSVEIVDDVLDSWSERTLKGYRSLWRRMATERWVVADVARYCARATASQVKQAIAAWHHFEQFGNAHYVLIRQGRAKRRSIRARVPKAYAAVPMGRLLEVACAPVQRRLFTCARRNLSVLLAIEFVARVDDLRKLSLPIMHQGKFVCYIQRDKTGRVRRKRVNSAFVARRLREYLELRPRGGQYLLCCSFGFMVTADTIRRDIRGALSAAGARGDVTPHCIRGATSSALRDAGLPVDSIQQLGHWASRATFSQVYDVSMPTESPVEVLCRFFGVERPLSE